ncbi:hypothetical protein O3P69_017199 [Scylla paramamosain]|uniref:Uncharacterized protein n=1 Tax=Scylla paramamosain TaxID=85552 RepID=A0AAW0TVW0_SCYPA
MDDRYKKRGLKFNSTLDSRVLRAVHNHQRQRGRRDDVVNLRRQMGTLEDSPQVACPPKAPVNNAEKEAELKQKGLERYQQMLKWKEMRKKQLEKEKKKRMPSFKTGLYQPSPPKYLVSKEQKELGKTPQASLKKRVATPGVSLRKVPVFHLGGTPATSLLRVPQFHTGLTPSVSTKKLILTSKKENKQEDHTIAQRTQGALKNENAKPGRKIGVRRHATRQRKPNEYKDLGVQPLPLTPPVAASQGKTEKPALQGLAFPSFAPADFAFNFEALQVPKSECPSAALPDDSVAPSVTEASQGQLNDKKVDFEVVDPVEGKPVEDVSALQDNLSFQDNDVKISKACESEIQPANEENSSLQEEKDAVISESGKNETQPANQEKLSPEQDRNVDTFETSEGETKPENEENSSLQEACISETSENMIQSADQEKSFMQEDNNAYTSEASENETELGNQENLSLQEDHVCISESNESTIQTANQEKSPKQDKNVDVSQTDECELESESDRRNVHEMLADQIPEDINHDENAEAEDHPESLCNKEKMNEDICAKPEENTEGTCVRAEDNCLSLHGGHISPLKVQNGENANPKPKRSSRAATTPAKYLTRRSIACCFDGTVTPTLSRLRPRTPCSRNTRRSLSAHCDSPWEMYTPSRRCSVKKTPRRSVSKAPKLTGLQESHDASLMAPEITVARSLYCDTEAEMVNASEKSVPLSDLHKTTTVYDLKNSSSPLMTPENTFRREHGMWTVETSPWINAQRSKKRNKKKTADSLPTDGSPIPSHLIPSLPASNATEANAGEEDAVRTNLLLLLQPSTTDNVESPEMDVWGESPAPNALGTPKTSKLNQSSQGEKVQPEEMPCVVEDLEARDKEASVCAVPESAVSGSILIPCVDGDDKVGQRRKARKSRKSVMFATEEQENVKTNKLPGTPVHTSTRVSMGLFAKVDLNVEHPINEDQDLIVFETPKSEKKTACTRRSARISLLPGMTPSPLKETAAPLPSDLITWDSPEPRRTSRYAASSLATPVRRSRRLSKAV